MLGSSSKQGFWRHLTVVAGVALLAANARAARLDHPTYSASGATAAQKQWNLICDPTDAVSGSTSTQYTPSVANLDTINAWAGFEIDEIDVVVVNTGQDSDNEGATYIDQFFPPAGTTSVIFSQYVAPPPEGDVVKSAAIATTQPTSTGTYTAYLDGPEIGDVQVFWAPLGSESGDGITVAAAKIAAVRTSSFRANYLRGRGGPTHSDVDTHVIIFDSAPGNTSLRATFTNYANGGGGNFPNYFYVPDSYTGPGFTYTASQIQPSTVTLSLLPPPPQNPCGGHGGKTGPSGW